MTVMSEPMSISIIVGTLLSIIAHMYGLTCLVLFDVIHALIVLNVRFMLHHKLIHISMARFMFHKDVLFAA